MKIFVTGATGFIGEEVACGLRRNGHDVQGLARTIQNNPTVQRLVEQEVRIIQGDLTQPETYKDIIRDCDIIIHCAADLMNYGAVDNPTVDTVLSVCGESNGDEQSGRKKKIFLYTSGIMCYAEGKDKILTEEDANLAEGWVLEERHINEQKVLRSSAVYGCVIRPAWVFGKRSKHFIQYFLQTLSNPSTMIIAHPNKSYSEVHIDDLVQFYILACECASPETTLQSQMYNVADASRYTNMEIARAFTAAMNWQGQLIAEEDCEEGKDELWKFRNRTVLVDSSKAQKMLGFQCKHKLMFDNIELLKTSCLARNMIQQ